MNYTNILSTNSSNPVIMILFENCFYLTIYYIKTNYPKQ